MSDHEFWAGQSLVTEPGPAAAAIDQLPTDLGVFRAVSQQLVFHHWADGDWAENGIAPERLSEIDTRYAAAMFARLGELADLPLSANRQPRQRLVGCCRDFTVLFVSMARHKGIPARGRIGFAGYLIGGWLIDHMIAEVWDGPAGRWRLVEPEIHDDHPHPDGGGSFDALDVPPDRFLTAPRAWQLARSGAVDAERFVISPDLELPTTWGMPQLRRSLVRDLAALNKTEMLLWEDWGIQDSRPPADRRFGQPGGSVTSAVCRSIGKPEAAAFQRLPSGWPGSDRQIGHVASGRTRAEPAASWLQT